MRALFRTTIAVASTIQALLSPSVGAAAPPTPTLPAGYVWFGQIVSFDSTARTVTVDARYREHVDRYIGDFMRGDRITMTWATPGPGETDAIIYVGHYTAQDRGSWGYVLPAEFVSADIPKHHVTFTIPVPPKALKTLRAASAGSWIKVTMPFAQPDATAAISAIELAAEPHERSGTHPTA